MRFRIHHEWLEAPGVRHPGEAATWARVAFILGDRPLSVQDERRGTVRDGVFGSTLPLVEWLVDAWPRLLHERRYPTLGDDRRMREWKYYHSLRASRDGFAMPDLTFRRHDGGTIVATARYDRDLAPGISVRFLRDAEERLPILEVQAQLAALIDATLEQLRVVDDHHAAELYAAWTDSRTQTAYLAAMLGVETSQLAGLERGMVETLTKPEAAISLALAEASTEPDLTTRIVNAERVAASVPQGSRLTPEWLRVSKVTHKERERPWLTGWEAAEEFRRAVGVPADFAPRSNLQAFLEAKCGWPQDSQLHTAPIEVAGVDAVHVQRAGQTPVVMTAERHLPAKRFRVARCLYYFLFKRTGGGTVGVADSPILPELSEANAFAAELVAPVAALRNMVPSGGIWHERDIYSAARALQVSPMVVHHQVDNRKLGVQVSA